MTLLRTGGEILVANLLAQGATHAFCVPGESFLAVLDALHDVRDRLRLLVCRQEGGVAYMAEAHGKLTGRPGIAFVTRGPGASNAAIGIHTAAQDSTPMIVFVGQVGGDFVDREAFQEIDYRRMYGSVAKWAAQIDRAERIPEYVARAFRVAMSGRPGPVVLALPEDMLTARAECADAARVEPIGAAPDAAQAAAARALLAGARRPLLLVGGSRWDSDACAALKRFAEANEVPVACAFRHQHLFDNRHPNYAGRRRRRRQSELWPRASARPTYCSSSASGWARSRRRATRCVEAPTPKQCLIHVHPGADELGRVYQPALAIAATPGAFFALMNREPGAGHGGLARLARRHARRPRGLARAASGPRPARHVAGGVVARRQAARRCDSHQWRGQLSRRGCTGCFATAASARSSRPTPARWATACRRRVAAKVLHPERMVVSWNGDGCFLMNGQELATAVQYGLAVIFVVVDNGMYGTIRMHQERNYPARVSGSDLTNPDFAALARAYGAHGETVLRTEEFAPAFERAHASGKPALLHLKLDPQALTPNASLDALRAQGLAAKHR